ncbi:unnamed protein product [Coccothraustes coccothraustes]
MRRRGPDAEVCWRKRVPGGRAGPVPGYRSRWAGPCSAEEGCSTSFTCPGRCQRSVPGPGRLCALGSSPRRLGGSGGLRCVRAKAVYVFDVLRVLLACGEHHRLPEDTGLCAGRSREKAGRAGPVPWDLQELITSIHSQPPESVFVLKCGSKGKYG